MPEDARPNEDEVNPYAPPRKSSSRPPRRRGAKNSRYSYRDSGGLTRTLKLLLWLGIAVGLIAVVSGVMQQQLLETIASGGAFTDEEATAKDL